MESESNDELLKLLHTESLLNEVNPPTDVTLFDQTDGHPRGLQKRGRRKFKIDFNSIFVFSLLECLWKVCSWALDKRSLRSSGPSSSSSSSNSVDALSKLLY